MGDIDYWGGNFPRERISDLLDILYELTGKTAFKNYKSCFEKSRIYFEDEDSWKKPKRGFGLGNLNFISTLVHIGVILVMKFRYGWSGICGSDDSVIGIPDTPSNYKRCIKRWKKTMLQLGLPPKDKKIFISKANVINEIYTKTRIYDLDYSKMQQRFIELYCCKYALTTYQCKQRVQAAQSELFTMVEPESIRTFLDFHVLKHFKDEFDKTEIEAPPFLGGWYSRNKYSNMDYSLVDLESSLDLLSSEMIAFAAVMDYSRLEFLSDIRISHKKKLEPIFENQLKELEAPEDDLQRRFVFRYGVGSVHKVSADKMNKRGLKNAKPNILCAQHLLVQSARVKLYRTIKAPRGLISRKDLMWHWLINLRKLGHDNLAVPNGMLLDLNEEESEFDIIHTKDRIESRFADNLFLNHIPLQSTRVISRAYWINQSLFPYQLNVERRNRMEFLHPSIFFEKWTDKLSVRGRVYKNKSVPKETYKGQLWQFGSNPKLLMLEYHSRNFLSEEFRRTDFSLVKDLPEQPVLTEEMFSKTIEDLTLDIELKRDGTVSTSQTYSYYKLQNEDRLVKVDHQVQQVIVDHPRLEFEIIELLRHSDLDAVIATLKTHLPSHRRECGSSTSDSEPEISSGSSLAATSSPHRQRILRYLHQGFATFGQGE